MITDNDDRLLAELRRILTAIDPVPERVLLTARDAFAWRSTDDNQTEPLTEETGDET